MRWFGLFHIPVIPLINRRIIPRDSKIIGRYIVKVGQHELIFTKTLFFFVKKDKYPLQSCSSGESTPLPTKVFPICKT